jgi:hypothetical protein
MQRKTFSSSAKRHRFNKTSFSDQQTSNSKRLKKQFGKVHSLGAMLLALQKIMLQVEHQEISHILVLIFLL